MTFDILYVRVFLRWFKKLRQVSLTHSSIVAGKEDCMIPH